MRQTLPVTDEDDSDERSPQKVQSVVMRKSIAETPSGKVAPGKIKSNHQEVEMIAMKDEQLIYDLVGFGSSQREVKLDDS
jgi:hypothetical protein